MEHLRFGYSGHISFSPPLIRSPDALPLSALCITAPQIFQEVFATEPVLLQHKRCVVVMPAAQNMK